MPINHEKKLLFIHIPKTAGTTVKHYLKIHKIPLIHSHDSFETLLKKYGKQIRDYFSFAIVRNPWDKHLSQFLHWQDNLKKWKTGVTFEDYLNNLQNLKKISVGNNFQLGLLATPQFNYLCDGDKVGVKYILKFENLANDFKFVQEYLDSSIPLEKIQPFINATKHEHYSRYYHNDKMIKVVEQVNSKDISFFNYRFDIINPAPPVTKIFIESS